METIESRLNIIKDQLQDLYEEFEDWLTDFLSWFFEDVAFTLLPIVVIASLKAIT